MVSCGSLLWANGFVAAVTVGVKSILAAGSRVPMERCVGCMYCTLLSRVCVYTQCCSYNRIRVMLMLGCSIHVPERVTRLHIRASQRNGMSALGNCAVHTRC